MLHINGRGEYSEDEDNYRSYIANATCTEDMASLTLAAAAGTLASSAASLSGMKLSPPSVRPVAGVKATIAPVRAAASQVYQAEKEREMMRRRALVLGAFASAIAVASNLQNDAALAEVDPKKKRNKCPTICVQNPTASCCFSY